MPEKEQQTPDPYAQTLKLLEQLDEKMQNLDPVATTYKKISDQIFKWGMGILAAAVIWAGSSIVQAKDERYETNKRIDLIEQRLSLGTTETKYLELKQSYETVVKKVEDQGKEITELKLELARLRNN